MEVSKQSIRTMIAIVLGAFFLIGLGCNVTAKRPSQAYTRDGKVYGVTKGSFRQRWWNYYERGVSFADGQFWKEAEEDFRTALRLRGDDKRRARTYGMHFVDYFPRRELGVTLFYEGRYPEAIKELETALNSVKTAKAEFYLDRARKAWLEGRNADAQAPEITLQSPEEGTFSNGLNVVVTGVVRDDTYVKEVQVNGINVRVDLAAPEIPFSVKVPLKSGENPIVVMATDLTGKSSLLRRKVKVDRQGPILNIDEPSGENLPSTAGLRLKGYAFDDSGISEIRVNGKEILNSLAEDVPLDHPISLASGENRVVVEAVDRVGNRTRAEILLSGNKGMAQKSDSAPKKILLASLDATDLSGRRSDLPLFAADSALSDSDLSPFLMASNAPADVNPPSIELKGWTEDQTVFLEQAYLEGSIRDDENVAQLAVNDQTILKKPGKNVFFSHLAELNEGDNVFIIQGKDEAGNQAQAEVRIHRKLQKVQEVGSRMTVALLPLERKGETGVAGEVVEDILLNAITERGRFEMVERRRLEEVLKEQQLSASDLVDPEAAVRLGKVLAAGAVLMGSISEKENSVDIFARVVDTETSLILATVDVYGENVDTQVMRQLCQGLVLKLCDELPLTEGLVVQVKGKKLVLDLGKASKVKKGMHLIVFHEGEPIKHPVTGQILGADVEELGKARIQAVLDQMSNAELLDDNTTASQTASIEPMAKVITQ